MLFRIFIKGYGILFNGNKDKKCTAIKLTCLEGIGGWGYLSYDTPSTTHKYTPLPSITSEIPDGNH